MTATLNPSDRLAIDTDFYRATNKDLIDFSDEQLVHHYNTNGFFEGRPSSSSCLREHFIAELEYNSALEIGPFTNPCLYGPNVFYCDVLDKESLIERAIAHNVSHDQTPDIDFLITDCSLKSIKRKFDLVFSSHCIEHQPDFVEHLNEVADLLRTGGSYATIIPDARYCFDASLPKTKISEIFNAHQIRRKVHSIGSIVEHLAMTTHNETSVHWERNGEMANAYYEIDRLKVKHAFNLLETSEGNYVDVHAWQFDPVTFSEIIQCLIDLDKIKFKSIICNGPVSGRNEFTATLVK